MCLASRTASWCSQRTCTCESDCTTLKNDATQLALHSSCACACAGPQPRQVHSFNTLLVCFRALVVKLAFSVPCLAAGISRVHTVIHSLQHQRRPSRRAADGVLWQRSALSVSSGVTASRGAGAHGSWPAAAARARSDAWGCSDGAILHHADSSTRTARLGGATDPGTARSSHLAPAVHADSFTSSDTRSAQPIAQKHHTRTRQTPAQPAPQPAEHPAHHYNPIRCPGVQLSGRSELTRRHRTASCSFAAAQPPAQQRARLQQRHQGVLFVATITFHVTQPLQWARRCRLGKPAGGCVRQRQRHACMWLLLPNGSCRACVHGTLGELSRAERHRHNRA